MSTRIAASDFGSLFEGIEASSWRWESQGYYAVDEPALQAWLAGHGQRGDADDLAWRAQVQGMRARGIPFERVRMLTDPVTEYVHYQLDTTAWNIDSGEDIRWVTQAAARELQLPEYDFYLFDSNRVAILRFDEGKTMLGVDLADDPATVAQHRAWRDEVWPLAIPHGEFLAAYRGM
jgi:hypothetical protein